MINMANKIKYFDLTVGTKEYRKAQRWCLKYRKTYTEYLDFIKNKKIFKSKNDYQKHHMLIHTHNITLEDYNKMFEKQNGCCAICNKHQIEFNKKLSVDHCHKTMIIRGLLCNHCNIALGYFKDNTDYLKNAIDYLSK
jgi:hypothetical protein